MYVVSRIDNDYFEKGKKYKIVSVELFEYQVEWKPNHLIWIGKDDTVRFEYYC